MANPLKTYSVQTASYIKLGGVSYRQGRIIVAARSRAAAVRLINDQGGHTSDYEMKQYGGQTWNFDDITQALSQPGIVFVQPLDAVGELRTKWWKLSEVQQ